MKPLYLVSACLAGVNCRYDGQAQADPAVLELVRQGKAIPICPEQLGGLPTPRPPAEIQNGDGEAVLTDQARVLNRNNEDVTEAFLKGARETLQLARLWNVKGAIFKNKSPSCGTCQIYDGSFQGRLKKGSGVTAALLKREQIPVFSEDSWRGQ